MASHQLTGFIEEEHAISFAITEQVAIGTFALTGPFPDPEFFEAVVPHFHKIILENIPLVVVGPDTGTTRDRSVNADSSDSNSGMATIILVTVFSFIRS